MLQTTVMLMLYWLVDLYSMVSGIWLVPCWKSAMDHPLGKTGGMPKSGASLVFGNPFFPWIKIHIWLSATYDASGLHIQAGEHKFHDDRPSSFGHKMLRNGR